MAADRAPTLVGPRFSRRWSAGSSSRASTSAYAGSRRSTGRSATCSSARSRSTAQARRRGPFPQGGFFLWLRPGSSEWKALADLEQAGRELPQPVHLRVFARPTELWCTLASDELGVPEVAKRAETAWAGARAKGAMVRWRRRARRDGQPGPRRGRGGSEWYHRSRCRGRLTMNRSGSPRRRGVTAQPSRDNASPISRRSSLKTQGRRSATWYRSPPYLARAFRCQGLPGGPGRWTPRRTPRRRLLFITTLLGPQFLVEIQVLAVVAP